MQDGPAFDRRHMGGNVGTPLPFTIGHENAGWVHAVGSHVTNFKVGDPVIVHPVMSCGKCLRCRAGEDMHCENLKFPGLTVDGGYAEYLKTSERALIKLEDNVKPSDVAPLADAGITAYRAVRKLSLGAARYSRSVNRNGRTRSYCGSAYERNGECGDIAMDQNEYRLNMALEYGADQGVLAGDRDVSDVRGLTRNVGVDFIIDFVGTDETHAKSMEMLRKGGTYFVVGYGGALKVPSLNIINNEFNIIGNLVGNYNELYELMQLYAQGKVKLHCTQYDLKEANQVLDMLDAGKINGRAVLVPA